MSKVQIGKAAKMHGISRRSLRYWEEQGILKSARGENGYRMYDSDNLRKINQIVMLKKLELPIQDIHSIFLTENPDNVIMILKKHLDSIKNKAKDINSLALLLELLINKLQSQNESSLLSLVNMIPDIENEQITNALFTVNERSSKMDNDVRIINLPKMTFASYTAKSETPEDDCAEVMNKFIEENGIKHMQGFRHFGFNNPNPTEGNPIYGYEMWAVVPKDYSVPSPLVKKHFDGGMFASLTCTLDNIGERWGTLYNWTMQSEKYELEYDEESNRIGLEECINYDAFNDPGSTLTDRQLDLLVPIKKK